MTGVSKQQYVNIASRNPNVQAGVISNNRYKNAIKNKRTNRCKNTNIQIVKTQTCRHTMSKHQNTNGQNSNTQRYSHITNILTDVKTPVQSKHQQATVYRETVATICIRSVKPQPKQSRHQHKRRLPSKHQHTDI